MAAVWGVSGSPVAEGDRGFLLFSSRRSRATKEVATCVREPG
jgi:hypothetical protein